MERPYERGIALIMPVLGLVLILCGCAFDPPGGPVNAPIKNHLLSFQPSTFGRKLSLTQIVTGKFSNQRYKMHFHVELENDQLAMVGLSEFGVTLFKILKIGKQTKLENVAWDRGSFDPSYLLSDFYLVEWPTAQLAKAYSELGLKFKTLKGGAIRRVSDADERLIAEVLYPDPGKPKVTIVRHFSPAYELQILTLQKRVGE